MANKDIIAIGGSSGSGRVLKRLLSSLPADLPASIFITTHVPSTAESMLAEMLQSVSRIPVRTALDAQPIEQGHVYVAARNRHLLLVEGAIRLGAGPRENMTRPAIDPMFRSAALSYGARTVGVVLTGMLSDGAAGLHAIGQRGGTTVVQHPLDAEAEADQMPRAALEATDVDHVVRADELAELLTDLANQAADGEPPVTDELLFEVEIAAGAPLGSQRLRQFSAPAALTCPECHGVLSEVKGGRPLRCRCQIGHAFTVDILASGNEQLDEAIRIAMRVMEERVELVQRMVRDARETGRRAVANLYEQRAEEYQRYARTLGEAALLTTRTNRAGGEQQA